MPSVHGRDVLVLFCSHTSPRVIVVPIDIACLPFIQFSVSSMTFVEPSRAL